MRRVLLLLPFVAACSDRITTVDEPIEPAAVVAWSGSVLELQSPSFTGADTVPVFTVGADTLKAEPSGEHAVRVTLPDTTGTIDITASFSDGRARPAGTISVVGFSGYSEGPGIGGNPVAIAGSMSFLANGEQGLVRFDAHTATTSVVLADSMHDPTCTLTPGQSAIPGIITAMRRLPNGNCRYYAWQNGAVIDSGPLTMRTWTSVYMGRGRWLINPKHAMYWWSSNTLTTLDPLEEPELVQISPTGDRIFHLLAWRSAGTPVFDSLGQIAFRLPLTDLNGLVFVSPDTAYVVGTTIERDTLWIRSIDPMTGAVYRSAALPDAYPSMMVADPNGRWFYLSLYSRNELLVIDRVTLRQVARLRPSSSTPGAYFGMISLLAVGSDHHAYVVSIQAWDQRPNSGQRSRVFRYDLIP